MQKASCKRAVARSADTRAASSRRWPSTVGGGHHRLRRDLLADGVRQARAGRVPAAVAPPLDGGAAPRRRARREVFLTEHFRYKPEHGCEEFLRAAAAKASNLWHPVKHRDCWLEYLDSCDASGCHMQVASKRIQHEVVNRRSMQLLAARCLSHTTLLTVRKYARICLYQPWHCRRRSLSSCYSTSA